MVDLEGAKIRILEAAARRWTEFERSKELVFRGSFVTGLWIGRERRRCDDLDFVAADGHPRAERVVADLRIALAVELDDGVRFETSDLEWRQIFEDTPQPGVRVTVPVCIGAIRDQLQIDVSSGDPIPFGSVPTVVDGKGGTFLISAPVPEVGFGWKLHGLVEREGLVWRPKDLADLWLMCEHVELDEEKLREAIKVAFGSRDGPIWRLDRLVGGTMGQSATSRRSWAKLRKAQPEMGLPERLAAVVDVVGDRVRPHWEALRIEPSVFEIAPSMAEMREALGDDPQFSERPWDEVEQSSSTTEAVRVRSPIRTTPRRLQSSDAGG